MPPQALKPFKAFRPQRANLRYAGAESSRLSNDFTMGISSADAAIDSRVLVLRNRSREMERDNPLTGRWLTLLENNVIGADGVQLQMQITDRDQVGPGGRLIPGQPDELANSVIEKAWKDWGKKRWRTGHGKTAFCSYSGAHSWRQIQNLALRSTKRDGSCFVLIHVDPEHNPYGFSLQLLEADYLDTRYSQNLKNGNRVRMGIEKDPTGRTVAWHLFTSHPGDRLNWTAHNKMVRDRIPADRVIHLFDPKRIEQNEGVPDNHAVLLRMKMLEGYDEAELVAARVAANKAGFFVRSTPDGYEPSQEELADGTGISDTEPGEWIDLPMGVDVKTWDPNHPNSGYGDFSKSAKRDIAAGLNISYNALGNDLEGVNFSSIRAGVLEDREQWKKTQNWLIEELIAPVFEYWLEIALLAGAIKLPNGNALPWSRYEKFNQPRHIARRWPWVDPQKDAAANLLQINNGLKSRRAIIAETGADIADVYAEQEADNALAEKHGLKFPADQPAPPPADPPPPTE